MCGKGNIPPVREERRTPLNSRNKDRYSEKSPNDATPLSRDEVVEQCYLPIIKSPNPWLVGPKPPLVGGTAKLLGTACERN